MPKTIASERKTVDYPTPLLRQVDKSRGMDTFSTTARKAMELWVAYRDAPISAQNEVRRLLQFDG